MGRKIPQSTVPSKQSSPGKQFRAGLKKSKLKELFIWIIAAQDEDISYDSMTFWGMILPDEVYSIVNSDQEFEDWKCNLGSFEETMNQFPLVTLGTFRHGFSLMGCDQCIRGKHLEPIFLHRWCPEPQHSTVVSTVYGKLPDHNQEKNFFVLGVYGGVFEAYPNPPTTGALPIGMLIIKPRPFRL